MKMIEISTSPNHHVVKIRQCKNRFQNFNTFWIKKHLSCKRLRLLMHSRIYKNFYETS